MKEILEKLQFDLMSTPTRQTTAVSILAGGVDTLVNQPISALKQRLQSGYSFTLNPLILYRGLGSALVFMAPIMTTRMGVNESLNKLSFFKTYNTPLSIKKITCSFFAGAASSVFTNPVELTMTYQQKYGGTFFNALKCIKHSNNSFVSIYYGFTSIAIRDGLFTSGFLSGTPIIKRKIKPTIDNVQRKHIPVMNVELTSSILAGYMSGLIAALTSQPFDTLRGLMHTSTVGGKKLLAYDAFKSIYSQNGFAGFYKGGLWRCIRVVSTSTVLPLAIEKLNTRFKKIN